jgi:hypothetical protein
MLAPVASLSRLLLNLQRDDNHLHGLVFLFMILPPALPPGLQMFQMARVLAIRVSLD